MDDFVARQLVSTCDLGATGGTPMESAAFGEELRASSAVDGSVDAATTEEGFVGRIHDAGNSKPRYVVADEFDLVVERLTRWVR